MDQLNAVEMENPESQQPRLKAFEIVKTNLATAGITPTLADQSYPLNGTILFGFVVLGLSIFSATAFIIYEAETITDYTQSVYSCSLLGVISFGFINSVFKVVKLYEMIHCYDDIINTSEYLCVLPESDLRLSRLLSQHSFCFQ